MAKLTRKQIKEGLEQIPMESLLLGAAGKQIGATLTPKQREFARMIAMGESKAGAYRKTHSTVEGAKRHRQRGYELSQRRDIQETAEAFAEAQRFAESHTPAQLRAFVVQQLTAHAANDDNPPSVRINALKLLGTVAEVGAFVDRKEVVTIKQSGDIRSRIMDKLQLIGASSTIEHNTEQDDAQDADSLLHELTATPSDAQDADPTPTGTPQFEGVDGAEGSHIIPHTQSSSIPHIRIPAEPSTHIQTLTDSTPLTDLDTETLQCREIEQ
jgi:hypothetical protein